MNLLLVVLTSIGLFAVGLCFLFLFPVVGNGLVFLFSAFKMEQFGAKRQKV